MQWRTTQPVHGFLVSVALYSTDGQLLCEVHRALGTLPGPEGQLSLWFERLDIAAGHYYVDVGAYSADWSTTYDYHWRVYRITVGGHGDGKGPLRPPARWEVTAT